MAIRRCVACERILEHGARTCSTCGHPQRMPLIEVGIYLLSFLIALTILFGAVIYARYGYLLIF